MIWSDTGPLISVLQSATLDLVVALFGTVHLSTTCWIELVGHGWEVALTQAGSALVFHELMDDEMAVAENIAAQIAVHPVSKDADPRNHRGEADVMALMQCPDFAGSILLLDELAARAVAQGLGLTITGFAGVLLLAADEGLLSADDVKDRLELCQRQGTHYSTSFIEQIYKRAKEGAV